jgi:hypothetical protein
MPDIGHTYAYSSRLSSSTEIEGYAHRIPRLWHDPQLGRFPSQRFFLLRQLVHAFPDPIRLFITCASAILEDPECLASREVEEQKLRYLENRLSWGLEISSEVPVKAQ